MHSNFFQRLQLNLSKLILFFVLALSLFTINRIVLLIRFKPDDLFDQFWIDIYKSFWMGSRFDTQSILYAMLPILIVGLICAIPKSKKASALYNRFLRIYGLFALSVFVILLILDQQFYSFFQSHFNAITFGIIEDDTMAVLKSMWTDHPVIRILLIILLVIILISLLLKIIVKLNFRFLKSNNGIVQSVFLLVLLGCYFIGLRGSLGTFPLEKDDVTVSDNTFLIFLTPNAVFSLIQAFSDKSNLFQDFDNQELLHSYGYDNLQSVYQDYFTIDEPQDIDGFEPLWNNTKKDVYIEENQPDVVFFLMESMGDYYLDFHDDAQFNLLGNFAPHFKTDIVFRNFVSDENGTIPSLENLMTSVPYHPFAQTVHKNTPLPTSVALPYKNAGYETIFITGGKLGWRNLDDFVPSQGFDLVRSGASIQNSLPNVQTNEWGVYDEHLFDYVYQLLNEPRASKETNLESGGNDKNRKPRFIFVLTTTNHTPFTRPKDYTPFPIVLSDSIKELTNHHPLALENFYNYQYSSNCLGNFVTKVKDSSLKDQTIISATGDHNTWMLFHYTEKTLHRKFGVPFYLYAPQRYLEGKQIDTHRFGSHKDIFPTLFNLSLSDKKYFNSGNDLLTNNSKTLFYGVNEKSIAVDKDGLIDGLNSPNPRFFSWENNKHSVLEVSQENSTPLLKASKSRQVLINYYFNELLGGSKLEYSE